MDTKIDPELAKWGLIVSGVIVVTFLVGTAYVWGKAMNEAQSGSKNLAMWATGDTFLRLGTVLVVLTAAVMLGITGALTEGAVALLSGVAGFVLGGLPRDRSKVERQSNE